MFTKPDAVAYIKDLLVHGASRAVVTGLHNERWRIEEEGDIYADTLLVEVDPKNADKFEKWVEMSPQRPDEFDKDGNFYRLWWD